MRISDWSSDVCSSDLRRDRAHIIVELPAIAAVLVLRDAVKRQVPRPVRRKMPVFFLHPGQALVDGGVAPRLPAGEMLLLVYPSAHAAVDAHPLQLRFELGRKAQTLDCNQPRPKMGRAHVCPVTNAKSGWL